MRKSGYLNKSARLIPKHSLQLWLALRQYGSPEDEDGLSNLLMLVAQRRVGNRPGRIEPRAIKRRPQANPMLTTPPQSARADVRKNGHPKHVKQVPFKSAPLTPSIFILLRHTSI
jgi:hypothetical protein